MTRIALSLALALALALAWSIWRGNTHKADNTRLRANVAALEAVQARQAEVNAVHRAHIQRMQDERAARNETIRQLEALEGGDAPLDDYFRDAAGILWPR